MIQLKSFGEMLSDMANSLEANEKIIELRNEVSAKQKVAETALTEAEKANAAAEEAVKRLEEALKQQSKDDVVTIEAFETAEQKIARLEKELADVRRISQLEKELEAVNASNSKSLEDVQVEVVEQTATTTTKEVLVATPKVAAEKAAINSTDNVEETSKPTPPSATPKVAADKLNVSGAPKGTSKPITEIYEPETPKSGVKGAAARSK